MATVTLEMAPRNGEARQIDAVLLHQYAAVRSGHRHWEVQLHNGDWIPIDTAQWRYNDSELVNDEWSVSDPATVRPMLDPVEMVDTADIQGSGCRCTFWRLGPLHQDGKPPWMYARYPSPDCPFHLGGTE